MKSVHFARRIKRKSFIPVRTMKVLFYRVDRKGVSGIYPKMENYNNLLYYLRRFIGKKGYSPSFREIMEDMDISSTSVVAYYLDNLQEMGFITRQPHKPRSIRVL